ncbi:MAG: enoyl-CoA hydratase-related protein [bacterium]|nr:enoyl-CoA hydratase-related protein [bacterium]
MWLETEDRGPIRRLWLNRPFRKNAIPPEGWRELQEAFSAFESSSQRVLVISGRGGDFCAGADLDPSAGPRSGGVVDAQRRMKVVGDTAVALHKLTKPTVAAVDGVAVGAGMSLALGCDVVVATRRARFSAIFARRGLSLDMGLSWLLPRLAGAQFAKEIALSGRMVPAAEAMERGLVWAVVDPDRLEERAAEVAEGFLAGAPVAQMFIKQGLDRSWELSLEEATAWEGQSQSICLGTDDHREGVASFLQKRPPRFRGR